MSAGSSVAAAAGVGVRRFGVTLRAVLQRTPRTLRSYLEELDAPGQAEGPAAES